MTIDKTKAKNTSTVVNAPLTNNKGRLGREIKRHTSVYLLLLIPLVYYIVFKYVPVFLEAHGSVLRTSRISSIPSISGNC